MVLIAAALYLPANVANIVGRAWYYLGGGDAGLTKTGAIDTLSAADLAAESARAVSGEAAAAAVA